MLDIYICEDNSEQRKFIENLVKDYYIIKNLDVTIAISSDSPDEVLNCFEKSDTTSLFFLDISLNSSINGMELASKIREKGKKAFIVFLTSHTELTLLTFEYKLEAMDFISKGVNAESIKSRVTGCIDVAIARSNLTPNKKIINLNIDDKVIYLDTAEIIFIETTHIIHKLRLYTANRTLEFTGELKNMEEQLDSDFIRCHKSFIINKKKIVSIDKSNNFVTLEGSMECPLSKTAKKLLI